MTQKEIAERLGVSAATVSLVVNDPATLRVSAPTRKRILDLYRRNAVRRRSPGRVRIALIMDLAAPVRAPYYASHMQRLVVAVEQAGREAGCDVQIVPADRADDLAAGHDPYGLSGIIIHARWNEAQLLRRLRARTQVVATSLLGAAAGCDTVLPDTLEASIAAVTHLYRHGHRRIAFIGTGGKGDGDSNRQQGVLWRYAGYCAGLREWHLAGEERYAFLPPIDTVGDREAEFFREALRFLRKGKKPPTAVLCQNDFFAIRLMHFAREADIEVPGELSVVGFDNVEHGALCSPALTTIDSNPDEMGRAAVQALRWRIETASTLEPRRILVRPRLVERASVATLKP